MEQVLGVVAVLCLLGLTLWLLRAKGLAHLQGGRKTGILTAVDRLPLGPQHALHLVRIGDRAVLVAVSPSGCSVLETMPWRAVEEARKSGGGTA